jgi:hypothetical protein
MKIQELLDKDIIGTCALQRRQHLLCQEVCMVGRVDCLGYAKDAMSDWFPPAELGGVLDVINPTRLI